MVTRFGMSPELGNVDLASNHDTLSAGTKQLIESEVRRVIEEGWVRATKLLQSKRKELDLLAKALIDYETLNKEEAFKVIKGETLEGKTIMPSGPMKIPDVGHPALGGASLPDVPKIPGSTPQGESEGKEPPAGCAVA
jgi:ATP-dependent metalloprotease